MTASFSAWKICDGHPGIKGKHLDNWVPQRMKGKQWSKDGKGAELRSVTARIERLGAETFMEVELVEFEDGGIVRCGGWRHREDEQWGMDFYRCRMDDG